jgi:AraC-like DNA-binding protein
MDVVSDAITAIRTGRPFFARTVRTPPWGLRFPASSGAGFHVVFQGACWLLRGDGGAPLALHAGDVLFVSHGQEIALADHPSSPLVDVAPEMDDAWTPLDRVATSAAVLICGAYQLDGASPHPLLAELPGVVHLPKRVGRHAPLSAIVDLLVSAALLRIHRAPRHPWTVEELGAQVGLSRAAFARRFTTLVGQPPLAYLTWWRMTSAGALLRGSDASLHAIAERAGYASESAFNRAFKRQYGSTPGDYRRQYTRPPLKPATPAAVTGV